MMMLIASLHFAPLIFDFLSATPFWFVVLSISVKNQFRQNDFLRLGLAVIHPSYPFHLIFGL